MTEKHYVGIDVGGTNIVYAVVNESGRVLEERRTKTLPERGAEGILAEMLSISLGWFAQDPSIAAIGIGLPGIIDAERGIAIDCPNLKWENVNIREAFAKDLPLPVHLENDVRCVALAERKFGAARGTDNAICIALGTGIGSGIFVKGQLLRGSLGAAGEVGHMNIIPSGGEKCGCGNTGCWETLASATAIIRQARIAMERAQKAGIPTVLREPIDGQQVAGAAQQGDAVALSVISEAGKFLGIGLANLVTLFNPECIVLGGGMSLAGEVLLDPARRELWQRAMPFAAVNTRLVQAELGDAAGVIGAAVLGMERG